jgi:hypothetical protein
MAGHDPIYIAYQQFMAALLQDWTVRTEDPWEATMFYVPALTYGYSSNTGEGMFRASWQGVVLNSIPH